MKKLRLVMVLPLILAMMGGLMMIGCNRDREKFSYETIIVQLTVEASDAATLSGRVFTPADFLPEVTLSEVRVLDGGVPTPLGLSIFLSLVLENPGRNNVLQAVDALNRRSDVYHASLNIFHTGGI